MDSEIFEKAQAVMSSRRNSAYAEYERRVNEINGRIPQIKEINSAIAASGKELISFISGNKSKDVSAKIEQLKRYNLNAQDMSRKLLVQYGYPADYLEIHYSCPICNDTGYTGADFCECFKQVCGKLASEQLNRKVHLKLSSFDTFSLSYYKGEDHETMQRILDFTRKYAAEFSRDSRSILMIGRTGLGKTHLSLAIANTVLSKGYSVIYDSAINILRDIEREHFSRERSSETIDLIMNTDLLILDDLGTEYETQFYSATIYNIVNTRLNTGRPTIISTNLDLLAINARYDERVVSRLISVYDCLEFKGDDIRLQLRKNTIE